MSEQPTLITLPPGKSMSRLDFRVQAHTADTSQYGVTITGKQIRLVATVRVVGFDVVAGTELSSELANLAKHVAAELDKALAHVVKADAVELRKP